LNLASLQNRYLMRPRHHGSSQRLDTCIQMAMIERAFGCIKLTPGLHGGNRSQFDWLTHLLMMRSLSPRVSNFEGEIDESAPFLNCNWPN
jgi:hypothetical protein